MNIKKTRQLWLAVFCLGLLVSTAPLFAQLTTTSNVIAPFAANQGGSTATISGSYQINGSLGEPAVSSSAISGYVLYPGLMSLMSAPGPVQNLSITNVSSATETLAWSAPGYDGELGALQPETSYYIQYASIAPVWNFLSAQIVISTQGANPGDSQTTTASGLSANTTYYFSLWTLDAQGDLSALSNATTAATLAQAPSTTPPTFLMVGASSITAQWAALSAGAAEGYELDASSTNFSGGTVYFSSTAVLSLSTLTVSGLSIGTLYYLRVGSLNLSGALNYTVLGSTETILPAYPPSPGSPIFTNISSYSVTANWTANGNAAGTMYDLQSSTAPDFSGSIASSNTYSLMGTTTTLNLDTTYYFRVNATTGSSVSAFTILGGTSTLASPPAAIVPAFVSVSSNALNLEWSVNGNPLNTSTYTVVASTGASYPNADSGNVILTTAPVGSPPSASLSELVPNTTYFVFAAGINWDNAPSAYVLLGSTATLAAPPLSAVSTFSAVSTGSFSVTWNANGNPLSTTTYIVQVSTDPNFTASSPPYQISFATAPNAGPAATFSSLNANTTYYFQVQAINVDGIATDFIDLGSTSTLAFAPSGLNFSPVTLDSIQLNWSGGMNGSGTQYVVNVSTDAGFGNGAAVTTAAVFDTFFSSSGLAANTTYYFQTAAVNNNGTDTAFVSAATATLASAPQASADPFDPVYVTSMTVNFLNGSPANAVGTVYDVQISTDPGFSVWTDSFTKNLSAGFSLYGGLSLSPNTTYYAQTAAMNYSGGETAFVNLGSTSTLATLPTSDGVTFSGLTANSFTLSWSSGNPINGYNPAGTEYDAQISPDPTFATGVIEDFVNDISDGFSGLVSGTKYYAQVRAISNQDVPTNFFNFGGSNSVTTLASAAPSFLNGSFQVGDSAGNYVPPTQYTDTTTPNLQIQVQSNQSPGLSVTNTPSELALWHLDEGAGATSADSSGDGYSLTLNNSPAWEPGLLGSSLLFNGSNNYAVSSDVSGSGFRDNDTTNNQWSVALWFNTTVAATNGYLFQMASSNAPGATTYDGEIGWDRTSPYPLTFEVDKNTTREVAESANTYTDGNWHFAVGVVNATGFYLYVDNVLVASATTAKSTTALTYPGPTYLWLGAASTVGTKMGGQGKGAYYSGQIDEVMVATVAFTASQVTQLYNLTQGQTHEMGAPNVDVSTQAGTNNSWTRLPANTFALTGADGTTSPQTWTSTTSLSNFNFIESDNAGSNQVMFLDDSLDSQLTTAQYTILVDTTPPSVPTFSPLTVPTTYGLTINGLSASDALSGLNATPFDVQASTDPAFGAVNADSGWMAGPNFTFNMLNPNTTYYVRAQARDAAGTQGNRSAWSSSQNLATLAVYPSTAAIPFLNVGYSSATLYWTALPQSSPAISSTSAEGYELDASTVPDFSDTLFSSVTYDVSDSTLTLNLDANTTYYFRVGSLNPAGLINYEALGSTVTLTIPVTLSLPSFIEVFTSSVTAQWALVPDTMTAASYQLEASSTNFSAAALGGTVYFSSSSAPGTSNLTVSSLDPNTTYYFRAASINWDGTPDYSILGATPTLSNAAAVLAPTFIGVFVSSVEARWAALPVSPPSSASAEGYELDASTVPDFSALILSTATIDVEDSTLTVKDMASQTTYYFRVGTLNPAGVLNLTALGSTVTLVSTDITPPDAVADLTASTDTASSLALEWSAPTDPGDDPFNGNYAIEYSTWTGVAWSTANAQVIFSTLSLTAGAAQNYILGGLNANTTYYVYLWTSDTVPNWSSLSNGATALMLANPAASPSIVSIGTETAVASWNPLPLSPSSATAQGYEFDASTAANFSGTLFSSATFNVSLSTLALSGLASNTTYFFRVGTFNSDDVPNYELLSATSTLSNPVSGPSAAFPDVFSASVTVSWTALPGGPPAATSEGYELDASTAPDFSGVIYSSITAQVLNSALTVSALTSDTTYYFRVGSLNWGQTPNYTILSATSTLSQPPTSLPPAYIFADNADISAQWNANGNPPNAIYEMDVSTAPNFTGIIFSSVAANTSATVSSLAPNTTYYGRVSAINNDNVPSSYLLLGSTETLASAPQVSPDPFDPVYVASMTVNFLNGSPTNPAGTIYDVQLSTDPAFSVWTDSFTQNLSASYTGLAPNTNYYAQAAAENWLGEFSTYTSLGSTSTLAVPPASDGVTFEGLTANSFTLSWSSGTPSTGYNSNGTTYDAQLSTTSGDFSDNIIENFAQNINTSFAGLQSGTVYYTQVRTISNQGVPTNFVSFGSTKTLSSDTPSFLNGTFQVGDSVGNYVPPTQYTDTTTPTIQVQVQSNQSPGLSVTNTPSELALWHLDEGAGATSADSSGNGYSLTLDNSPAWEPGLLGSSLLFNGSNNYAVSPNVSGTGFRNNDTTNNQWSVALWFKTAVAAETQGYLFQVANSGATGAATYDGELTWYASYPYALTFVVDKNTTREYAESANTYTDGNWHFAVGTVNTAGFYLYIDGVQVSSSAATTSTTARTYTTNSTYLWVGAASKVGTHGGGQAASAYYPGQIDEVMVATVAFTASKVTQLYNLTQGQTHEMGAPNVDVSTQAGTNNSWTRLPGNTFALTGANGTTSIQTWTSTTSLSNFNFIESDNAGANQAMFLESSLDSNETTAQYTILVDTTPPSVPTFSPLTAPTTYGLTINGLSASDALSGLNAAPFDIQASTDPAFGAVNGDSSWIAGPNFIFTSLNPNTTYYVRAQARDAAGTQGNRSAWSSSQNLATLAVYPSTAAIPFLNVGYSSATLYWTALPQSPPAASSTSAEGYELDASTIPNFSNLVYFSSTTNLATSSFIIQGLNFSNTYYFRLGSFNWINSLNYENLGPLEMQVDTSSSGIDLGNFDADLYVSTVSVSSIVVTNAGNIPETFTIWGATATAGTPWILGTSTGIDTVLLQGLWNSAQPSASQFQTAVTGSTVTSTSGAFGNYAGDENGVDVSSGTTRTLWFQFWRPTSISSSTIGVPQSFHVFVAPIYP